MNNQPGENWKQGLTIDDVAEVEKILTYINGDALVAFLDFLELQFPGHNALLKLTEIMREPECLAKEWIETPKDKKNIIARQIVFRRPEKYLKISESSLKTERTSPEAEMKKSITRIINAFVRLKLKLKDRLRDTKLIEQIIYKFVAAES